MALSFVDGLDQWSAKVLANSSRLFPLLPLEVN